VVVSIPTVAQNPVAFDQSLQAALGPSGCVPMMIMDEIHHEEARSWGALKTSLRNQAKAHGKDLIVLGLTGTPRDEQKERLIYYRSVQLMPPLKT